MEKYNEIKALQPPSDTNACTVIAVGILADVDYENASIAMELFGRKFRKGSSVCAMKKALDIFGFKVLPAIHPRKQGKSVKSFYTGKHMYYKSGKYTPITIVKEYPKGSYIVEFDTHVAAMIDGVIEDFTANTKHRVLALHEVVEE